MMRLLGMYPLNAHVFSGLACVVIGLPAWSQQFGPWSTPVNLGAPVNSAYVDSCVSISKDGLSLFFSSNRHTLNTASGDWDLYVAQRAAKDQPWGTPEQLPNVNLPGTMESCPAVSLDEHRLYFASNRPGGCGAGDLYVSRRQNRQDDFGWAPPVNLGCASDGYVNSPYGDFTPTFFEDESGTVVMYYQSWNAATKTWDLFESRMRRDDTFGPGVPVASLNTPFTEQGVAVRRDGLEVIFGSNRPGTVGALDLWAATRESTSEPWSAAVNLTVLNSNVNDAGRLAMSFDGTALYFTSPRAGGLGTSDLYITDRERLRGKR